MNPAILGWGEALPPHAIEQSAAAGLAHDLLGPAGNRLNGAIEALYRRTGVRRRSSVLLKAGASSEQPEQDFFPPAHDETYRGPGTAERMRAYAERAPELAGVAARQALRAAHADAATLTHLVTVSCSGFFAPGFDLALIDALGLPASVQRCHVGFMGCHGAINGLRVAEAFCRAEPGARVLLCALELCSLHYQYGTDTDHILSNALFADGAAAAVIACDAAGDAWRLRATGSVLLPDSADAMSWSIGDNGFTMTLSPRVPGIIEQHLQPWLEKWLMQYELCVERITSWAIHPGGPRIVIAAERALQLSREATAESRAVLAECGNMSSPTVLFILRRLAMRDAPRPCVALAFGPGLVAEAALFV